MQSKWLEWAQKIQATAQNGLTYTKNVFDIERYQYLQELAAEIIANHTNIEQSYLQDLFNQETGYATPKVDVRGAVFQNNKILLVKERSDGCWTLPGGWADIGESPSESVVKEILEESGYHTKATKLIAVYDRDKQGHPPHPNYIYKLFFQCELIGGSASISIETEDVGFFAEDNIPELSLGRILPNQITKLFEHYHNPNLAAEFD